MMPVWLEGLLQDLRYSVRSLWRSPGLVAVSALSLGLGIGLNAVLYMAISTIYWHEPSARDPQRVVGVELGNANQFSYPDYQDLLRAGFFESALGFRMGGMNLGSGRTVSRTTVLIVTPNFFDVLGVNAQIGRTFSATDEAPEREPRVAVITTGFWWNYLGSDPNAIGKSIDLNGVPYTVIGVLPDTYRAVTGWIGPAVYVPLSESTLPSFNNRATPSLTVLARLAPNTTITQAQQSVNTLGLALERAFPERLPTRGRPASVFPVAALQFRGTPAQFSFLATVAWVTAGLVLLIACVNVTGLLMARAAHRRRDFAIRVALGASRARMMRGILVESMLLVATGVVVGLPLAGSLRWLPMPAALISVQNAMSLDARLLPFAVGLVALATLVCGVIPAMRATRADIVHETREGSESTTARMGLRQGLVIAQVAMSLILIVAALLCVRSQMQIGSADLGFDIDHGVVVGFGLTRNQYAGQLRVAYAKQLVDRVSVIPGVTSVSVADIVPLGGNALLKSFHPAGRTDIPGTRPQTYRVGPSYFRTLAIPFVKGRDFTMLDNVESPMVAIVNETFVRTYFPGQDAIGQRIQTSGDPDAQIVGVVRDSHIGTIGEAPASVVYYDFAQSPADLVMHVRASGSPDALVATVKRAVEEIDHTVPVNVQTLRNATRLEFTMRRTGTVLMGVLGGVGLLLAAIGLYGVMSFVAAARTVEVGIRMALGATSARIRWEMLQRAIMVVLPGILIGAVLSWGMTPVFSTFLAGVSPYDPVAFAGAAVLLLLIGIVAGYGPARRSARLDPIKALRRP